MPSSPPNAEERPFDVIPYEVRRRHVEFGILSSWNVPNNPRTSKAIGRSWVPGPLATSTRVREWSEKPQAIDVDEIPRSPAGTYLGIEVAIKEVLPSNDYDVSKYFEREWRLMKWVYALLVVNWCAHPSAFVSRECRHPNVVLYLGLSRAPEPDGRIFIISEFIENGKDRNRQRSS